MSAPDAVAVMLTVGRRSCRWVLECWRRQTVRIPLLVWLDDAPHVTTLPDLPHVRFVRGPARGPDLAIGAIRHDAMMEAVAWSSATRLLLLDDDDYFAPEHAEATLSIRAPFVGAAWYGLDRSGDGGALELADAGGGPGPHSCWSVELDAYQRAGGYPDALVEDYWLRRRLEAAGFVPVAHDRVTHVRRLHPAGLFTDCGYSRRVLRQRSDLVCDLSPEWPAAYAAYATWCDRRG